jgi:hypothetical protein
MIALELLAARDRGRGVKKIQNEPLVVLLLLSQQLLLLFLQGLQQVPLLLLLLKDLGKPNCTTCTMQRHTCKVGP